MGKVIDFQKWKEKKEEERVIKAIDGMFSTTPCSGEIELKYFVSEDQLGNPFFFVEYTCE